MGRTADLHISLAELEARATIRPVSAGGGRKRRMGCPFHGSDHQRSLEANLDNGRFHCFNCGAQGNLDDGSERKQSHWVKPVDPQRGFRSQTVTSKIPPSRSAQTATRQQIPEERLGRFLRSAQVHLEDPPSLSYLGDRKVPLALAQSLGLGYFPPRTWPGRKGCRAMGRVAFPLHHPALGLVGIYSRAVDPGYPDHKAPAPLRHDVWGNRSIFNPEALAGPIMYLTESCFDCLAMLAVGYLPTAALVGTRGLRWEWLHRIDELYLCGDRDAEGLKATRALAHEAACHGIRAYLPGPDAYGGHLEPSEQWEKEGRITLLLGQC